MVDYVKCTREPKIRENKSSAVAEMGDRGHNRHGPKRGGGSCVPFAESWDRPRLIECGLRGCTKVYFRTKWHLDPSSRLATIHMGQKLGEDVPFFWG